MCTKNRQNTYVCQIPMVGDISMKRQWFILVAALSLVVGNVACGFLEREVAIEDTGLNITDFSDAPGGSSNGGVEIASIDLSRVWELSSLRSYRAEYQMEVWLDDDAEDSSLALTMTIEVTADPPAQHVISFYEAETFPSDMPTMETEMYIMGGVAYTKSSLFGGWTAFDGDMADLMSDTLLNPQDYVILPEKAQRKATPEKVNGIPAWHYTFDENDFENELIDYEKVTTEIWIAVEGGFIVKVETFIKTAALGEDLEDSIFAGLFDNATIRTTYNMSDINTDFSILLPEEAAAAEVTDLFGGFEFDSEWTREDVPFPEGAEVDYSFSDTIALRTPSSVPEVKAFMLPQMPDYGWVLEMENNSSDEHYLGDYTKGEDFLTLSIKADMFDEAQTNIHIDVKRAVPWTREDVVLPDDAYIERSFEGEVYVLTYFPVLDATNFMVSQLEVNGWVLKTVLQRTESGFLGTYTNGPETLSLMINPALDGQGRTRIEIILE